MVEFPIEGYEQGDTLAVCKDKFQAQTGILAEHMTNVMQNGKVLQNEQQVSGTMELMVHPNLLEYGFLTVPTKKYVPAADGYKGTFLTPEMNNYTYKKRPPPTL